MIAAPIDLDKLRGLLGIVVILATAFALSENRRAISPRVVFWGLVLQWGFALWVLGRLSRPVFSPSP